MTVGSTEEAWEGWLGSQGGSWSSGGIFQWPGVSPWEVWGLNSKLVSPAYSNGGGKGTQITAGFLSAWERLLETESLWKGQCTKFCLQSSALGSARGMQSGLKMCEESLGWWLWGLWPGERAEGTATRISVLSHSPYCGSHLFQAEHSPSGISLRGSNSPAHRNYSAPPCGV